MPIKTNKSKIHANKTNPKKSIKSNKNAINEEKYQRNPICGKYNLHFVKSVQIRSFFWSVFSCILNGYGDLVRIQENADQKKSRIETLFVEF